MSLLAHVVAIAAFGLATLLHSGTTTARDFDTCKQVSDYLNSARPEDQYARVVDLRNAVQLIDRISNLAIPCEDYVVERTRFELGSELEAYSQTFSDLTPQRTWAADAAEAFEQYLEWFLLLSEENRDRMIRILLRAQSVSDADFKRDRGKWLRKRVGNALHSLGVAYVRADQHESLLVSYERHAQESIEIFPNEVVRKWYKWLRARPEFQRDKQDAEIRELIASDSDISAQWTTFK